MKLKWDRCASSWPSALNMVKFSKMSVFSAFLWLSPLLPPYTWVVGYDLQGKVILRSPLDPPNPSCNINISLTLLTWPLEPHTWAQNSPPNLSHPKWDTTGWVPCSSWDDFSVLSGQETTSGPGYCFFLSLLMTLKTWWETHLVPLAVATLSPGEMRDVYKAMCVGVHAHTWSFY